MKKVLSVLFAMLILITALPYAVSAESVDYENTGLGSYFKFTADTIYDYGSVNNGAEITFKGNSFFPYYAPNDEKAITDFVTGGGMEDMFRIETASDYTTLILLDKFGRPFELLPGHSYTINYAAYNPVSFNWNQGYFCGASVNTNADGGYKVPGSKGTIEMGKARSIMSFKAGENGEGEWTSARLPNVFRFDGGEGALIKPGGGNRRVFIAEDPNGYLSEAEDNGGEFSGFVYDREFNDGKGAYVAKDDIKLEDITSFDTVTLTIPDKNNNPHPEFNYTEGEYGAVSFTIPYTLENEATMDNCNWSASTNNYLHLNLNGSKRKDLDDLGTPYVTMVDFLYIEIYDNAYSYCNYIDKAGNVIKTAEYKIGEDIEDFVPAAPKGQKFDGWYADAAYTTPISSSGVAGEGVTNFYAKFSDGASTENNNTVIIIAASLAALVLLASVIIIVLLKKSKKKE